MTKRSIVSFLAGFFFGSIFSALICITAEGYYVNKVDEDLQVPVNTKIYTSSDTHNPRDNLPNKPDLDEGQ